MEITLDTVQRSRIVGIDWLAASLIGHDVVAFKHRLTERRCALHATASYIAELS